MFDKRVSILYEKALKDEVELHFVSDGQVINSRISAAEKFHFGISLGLAKYYSDAISDNVKRATEQKLRKGEWPGRAPYGYQNITLENKTDIIVDDYASKIVQKAFELYATGAYSLQSLCDSLKKEYSLNWNVGYLDKVFNNPFYYGVMRWNKSQHPHRYPPLVNKTLFDQVQHVKSGFNTKKLNMSASPISTVVFCAVATVGCL